MISGADMQLVGWPDPASVVDSMDSRRSFCAIFASEALSAMVGDPFVPGATGRFEPNRPPSDGPRVKLARALPVVPIRERRRGGGLLQLSRGPDRRHAGRAHSRGLPQPPPPRPPAARARP